MCDGGRAGDNHTHFQSLRRSFVNKHRVSLSRSIQAQLPLVGRKPGIDNGKATVAFFRELLHQDSIDSAVGRSLPHLALRLDLQSHIHPASSARYIDSHATRHAICLPTMSRQPVNNGYSDRERRQDPSSSTAPSPAKVSNLAAGAAMASSYYQVQPTAQYSFGSGNGVDMSSLAPFLPPAHAGAATKGSNDAPFAANALHLRRFASEYDDTFDAFDDGMKTPMALGGGMAGGNAGFIAPNAQGSLDYFASTISGAPQMFQGAAVLQAPVQMTPQGYQTSAPFWPQQAPTMMQCSTGGESQTNGGFDVNMARRPSIDPLQAGNMPSGSSSSLSAASASAASLGSASTRSSMSVGGESVITPELSVITDVPNVGSSIFGTKGIPPRSSSMSQAELSSSTRAPIFYSGSGSSFTSLRQVASRESFYSAFSSPSSRATSPDTASSSMSYAASPVSFHEHQPTTMQMMRSDSDAASLAPSSLSSASMSRMDAMSSDATTAPFLNNAAAARVDTIHGENARLRQLADNMSISLPPPPRKRSKQDDEDEMEHHEAAAPKAKRNSSKADKHPIYHFSIRVENGVTIDETPDPGQPEAKYFTPNEEQLGLMDPRKRKQWKNCLNSRKNRKGQKEELAELREYRDLTEALVPNLQAQVAQLQAELEQERTKAKLLEAEKNQLQMFIQAVQGIPVPQ